MDGAMMEIGPYRVQPDGTLAYNDGSWDEFANLLFVDQPVGTGFSYVDTDSYVHELNTMGEQMVQFLEKFFTTFPEYTLDDVRVFSIFASGLRTDHTVDLYCWRVLRRTIHPLHRTGHPRS